MTATQLVPVVFEHDGAVFTSSRDIAAFFEKEVKHVHEAIRNLVSQEPSLGGSNFRPIKINDLRGESTSHYEMDRDGFVLLAMGFTGPKALKWKIRYIEAFNAMETELREKALARSASPLMLKEARLFLSQSLQLAKLAGMDRQQCAIAANQATRKATGFDFLAELGVTGLPAAHVSLASLVAAPDLPSPAEDAPPPKISVPRRTANSEWVRWYPHRALLDEQGLSVEERCAYRVILDLIFVNGGPIEQNERFIGGQMNCSTRMTASLVTALLRVGLLRKDDRGRLTSTVAEAEIKVR